MNAAHYHLLVNHLPIIFPIAGLLVLIGGFIFRSEIVKRTSFVIFIIAALSAIAASSTGDGAEEAIEHLPGISERLIHAHEHAAETFSIILYLLGGFSVIALWANWKQKSYSGLLSWFVIGFSVVVLFFSKQTGTSGGIIRHTEIRTDTTGIQGGPEQNSNDD
ncbi:MAG: hypothetical protein JST32_22050 [Bacteroidetes bacterium]|nr:hypothetical protein [Bacteroidota bacterium]